MNWDPEGVYRTLFGKNDYYAHPLSSIVGSSIWQKMDQGVIDLDDAIDYLSLANEPFGKEIDIFFRQSPYYIKPMEDSIAIAMRYRKLGYKIFLLSNFPEHGYKVIRDKFSFFDNFNGEVISWEFKAIKPNKAIYDILLSKYNLEPEVTIFIDDLESQYQSCRRLGYYRFTFYQRDEYAVGAGQTYINFRLTVYHGLHLQAGII